MTRCKPGAPSRSRAVGWDEALEATRTALEDQGAIPFATFWKQLDLTLALEPLRILDMRRNVVHVLDAHEARQWSLPIVFVCGMTERHFPQHHRENAIVPGLQTEEDHDNNERLLYDIATSRATVETILSYPRFDENGQDTLPSFFLQDLDVEDASSRVRPAPSFHVATPQALALRHVRVLRQTERVVHRNVSAVSVSVFREEDAEAGRTSARTARSIGRVAARQHYARSARRVVENAHPGRGGSR
ncbi:MAG: hypothetical protein WDO18_00785 [Acidobacteriota bacterium]